MKGPARSARLIRRRLGVLAVTSIGLAALAGGLIDVATAPSHVAPGPDAPPSAALTASAARAGANARLASARTVAAPVNPGLAPSSPPARVCGNAAVLTGPARPPSGAVTVSLSENAINLVSSHGPDTTFWFAPGDHVLGGGEYDQIIPRDGDTFIGGPGAIINGDHDNDYAFGQTAADVTIEYLTIENFGQRGGNNNEGVVNANAGKRWVIEHDTVEANAGAGVFLGNGDVLSGNCLTRNGQYGFSAYRPQGVEDLTLTGNEISFNDTYNWESRDPGCGCSGGGKFWQVNGATVTGNYVHGNYSVGLWVDTDNVGFDISDNYISDNVAQGIIYEISYNARIDDNTLVRNGLGAGPGNPGFPTGAIYLSESGSDARVHSRYREKTDIVGNVFEDNWSGVVLWESADRFCNSPANTSTGFCTLVDPRAVNIHTCTAANLKGARPGQAPVDYYDDCRWKTENVVVSGNTFDFDPAKIGPKCTPANGCGLQGLFSQYGTYPSWSPYKGEVVENAIAKRQGDRFVDNSYVGPWRFMVHDQSKIVTFAAWRSAWGQDRGSTYRP